MDTLEGMAWADANFSSSSCLRRPPSPWQFALLACALALIGSVALSPRFWCRYLCPAGTLMGLLSRRPFLRRKVSAACVQCGTCAKQCPMGAIGSDPYQTLHRECITCTTCVRACPEAAVTFGHDPMLAPPTLPMNRAARRFLLTTGLTGAGYAALSLTQLGHLHGRPGPGQVIPTRLLRPPGALPEADFLTHCIRCGLCFQVCPYDAVSLKRVVGQAVAVPYVDARRCSGCGWN